MGVGSSEKTLVYICRRISAGRESRLGNSLDEVAAEGQFNRTNPRLEESSSGGDDKSVGRAIVRIWPSYSMVICLSVVVAMLSAKVGRTTSMQLGNSVDASCVLLGEEIVERLKATLMKRSF